MVYAALGGAASFYSFPFLYYYGGPGGVVAAALLWTIPLGFLFTLSQCLFFYENDEILLFFKKLGVFVFFGASGFSLGFAARAAVPAAPAPGLEPARIIGVSGVLAEDPRLFNDSQGIGALTLTGATGEGGERVSAKGKLPVFFPAEAVPGLKEFGRGCEIYTEGKLIESDRGLLFRASGVYITKPASVIEQFRTAFRTGLLKKLAGPPGNTPVWSGLASALLLGVRDNLDTSLQAGFRDAGCSHVLALSGMHLALFSAVIAFFLKRLMGIRAASLAGGVFIVLYAYLAGAQPSLVRAAIMYLLGVACLWGFLKKEALNILCLAFIIQIVIQSESGLSVSFILSYLALAGILTIGEMIHEFFRGRLPEILGGSLSASIGAFLFTAPAVSLYFKTLRPVGLLAGIIIVPLASLFMILALAALVLLSLFPFLFAPFDFILTFIYRVLDFMVSLAGKVRGLEAANPLAVLAIVLVLCCLLVRLCYRDRSIRSNIAPFIN
jgi:competence protein ComEC